MNETSPQNGSLEQEKTTPGLSEPHFDDTSIATARPVEPLVEAGTIQRQSKLTSLFRRLSLSVILVVAVAIVTMATFVIGLATLRQQSRVDEPDEPVEAMKIEASMQPQTDAAAIAPNPKDAAQRSKVRNAKTNVGGHSKPVARKVGTIYYGR